MRLLFDAKRASFRDRRVVFVGVERMAVEYAATRRLSRFAFFMPLGRPHVATLVNDPERVHVVWAYGHEKLDASSVIRLKTLVSAGATEEFFEP